MIDTCRENFNFHRLFKKHTWKLCLINYQLKMWHTFDIFCMFLSHRFIVFFNYFYVIWIINNNWTRANSDDVISVNLENRHITLQRLWKITKKINYFLHDKSNSNDAIGFILSQLCSNETLKKLNIFMKWLKEWKNYLLSWLLLLP